MGIFDKLLAQLQKEGGYLATPEQKELLRKDRALAEVAALLALKKKVQEIWGDEDDDTRTRRGT